MRTTVTIDDKLLVAAKRHARERGHTLGQVVDAPLRRDLAGGSSHSGDRPPVPVFRGGTGPRPGLDMTSTRTMHEALDVELHLSDRR